MGVLIISLLKSREVAWRGGGGGGRSGQEGMWDQPRNLVSQNYYSIVLCLESFLFIQLRLWKTVP
jgi:hypothetical protein